VMGDLQLRGQRVSARTGRSAVQLQVRVHLDIGA
jgi:hypothetical protein